MQFTFIQSVHSNCDTRSSNTHIIELLNFIKYVIAVFQITTDCDLKCDL